MRLLLDSNALLWWLLDDDRLAAETLDLIDDGLNEVAVSVASVWELGIKHKSGKVSVPDGYLDVVAEEGILFLDITVSDAAAAAALPLHHKDPFDRMLIAQAQLGDYTVVTADRVFADYGVAVVSAR